MGVCGVHSGRGRLSSRILEGGRAQSPFGRNLVCGRAFLAWVRKGTSTVRATGTKKRKTQPKKREPSPELQGFLFLALGCLGLVSFVAPQGYVTQLAHSVLIGFFGPSVVIMLALLVLWGGLVLIGARRKMHPRRAWGVLVFLLWMPYALELLQKAAGPISTGAPGGLYGSAMAQGMGTAFGNLGRLVIAILWPLLGLTLLSSRLLPAALRGTGQGLARLADWFRRAIVDFVAPEEAQKPPVAARPAKAEQPTEEPEPQGVPTLPPVVPEVQEEAEGVPRPILRPKVPREGFELPPLGLLSPPAVATRTPPDTTQRAKLLRDTLMSFGVEVKIVDALSGPAVTRFELQPAPGVKVSRILALSDDISLAMAAADIRIEAPIPGKSAIGIEIPNSEVSPVLLREVLETPAYQQSPSSLTIALGKDIAGRPIVAALDRMPHLLIAGATGSGKSVCLNAAILSLLFKNPPDRVQLLLIDPKVVELKRFEGVPHLLAPVVTDPKKAAGVLRRVLRTMEDRYRLFAQAGVRDIERFNEVSETQLPKLVVIIDELADLMMVSPVEVEESICRLAQMARAAGIHLVVATQRPSVDVITGLIKANIPSRIAFAVSSQVDSRTILDQGGAEKLLGKGDMLFSPLGRPKPIRAQGVFVEEEDVERVVAFLKEQGEPQYNGEILEVDREDEEEDADLDELFAKAVKVVVEARQASASLLQRRMRVGYARAARLVEQMEQKGFVGPADGGKPREVRLSALEYQRLFEREKGADSAPF